MSKLQSTLERLAKLKNGGKSTKSEGKKYAKWWKPKNKEKNNVIFLTYPSTEDPFGIHFQHKNLFVEKFKTIPCKKFNKEEECIICELIDNLKKEDWKGNFPLWSPIEAKPRFYAPIVDLDDLESGVQYWGYGQSVQTQLENWLDNLEEDEHEFYSKEEMSKIIVSFDKDLPAAEMYKLDKKLLKGISSDQLEKWQSEVQELNEITANFYKSQEEEDEILSEYIERMKTKIEGLSSEGDKADTKKASSKLNSLKGED